MYIVENFRLPIETMDDFIYATQLLQAEALATAYTLWRRRFGGRGRELTSGALVWQYVRSPRADLTCQAGRLLAVHELVNH